MPQQIATAVENNFTKGLVSEFTGLNFPENAATDCDNCEFTLIGDVQRRLGINFETNYDVLLGSRLDVAVNTYKWDNAGGDGSVQIVAVQVGPVLNFWRSSSATNANPLSNQILVSTVFIPDFTATGGSFDSAFECQFADGNGYLFVFHPSCDPIYCTYSAGTITPHSINVQIRDFVGVDDVLADNFRPTTLSAAHQYNLTNQGWVTGSAWSAGSGTAGDGSTGSRSFTVAAGIVGIIAGQFVYLQGNRSGVPLFAYMYGTVTSYIGTTLTVNVTSSSTNVSPGTTFLNVWTISPVSTGYINTWLAAEGNYPSNADQWWRFKNASGVFDPATTQPNVSISLGPAPKGHFILSAFNQQRSIVSAVSGITDVTTTKRPTNGCWFQGRVWYTGINASQVASGTALNTTWTENIYFSQIVNKVSDFGRCFQTNDPTSEDLFDLLPTDGGVVVLQGSGPIFKLFPIQNGLLIFAANGVWFITGSQGIGFSAVDYTVTKLSAVKSISSTSYVDVQGLPYFWNEDGIYAVQPQQGGSLTVNVITYKTIDGFYADIPLMSKKYARGDYDPINYTIKWIYRDTLETDINSRYSFNRILNYNDANKAFYPYTIPSAPLSVNGINYVTYPGGTTAPDPDFKFLTTDFSPSFLTFSDMQDTGYKDWISFNGGTDYSSYFVTGYQLRGQAIRKFQLQYLQMYQRMGGETSSYNIQGIWDFANTGDSGRYTMTQRIDTPTGNFDFVFKRHKIRGSGYVLQIKVTSNTGLPFDIIGWSGVDTINQGT